MIDGTFDISVDTPKLHRRGTVVLKSSGDAIEGVLNVGELQGARFQGTCADKEFRFEGSGDFPSLGQVDYVATGSVWGNSLDMSVDTGAPGKTTIFGTRIGGASGSDVSSHDYMMRASTGDFGRDDATMYSGRFADGG